MPPTTNEFTVNFHLGNEHASFDTPGTTTVAEVKDRGLRELHMAVDPAFDYLVNFRGDLVENEAQTLAHLVERGGTNVTLHVQKRPKGG